MDKLEQYRGYIQQLLTEYAQPSSANSEIEKPIQWYSSSSISVRPKSPDIKCPDIKSFLLPTLISGHLFMYIEFDSISRVWIGESLF